VANHENLKNMSDKQFLTVNEVARLYNKSVQTVYRNIKAGKLSRQDNGLIALSECLRSYGSMPNQTINSVIPESNNMANNANLDVIALLQEKITALENSVNELKGENREIKSESLERERQAIEREKRLMALLEHQTGADKSGWLFGRLFK
jgi:predicted transcriptional regulator